MRKKKHEPDPYLHSRTVLELPNTSLEERFTKFLDSLEDVENIDALKKTREQEEGSKADYFADQRRAIIELKSLETDTKEKIEELLKPHREREEFPHFYGGWKLSDILKYLPDGKEINDQAIKSVTDSIERLYRKANSQIRVTKRNFDLPDSEGILILLNDKIDVLTPDMILYRIRKAANKKNPDGTLQYTDIRHLILFTEAHYNPAPQNRMGFLILQQPIAEDLNPELQAYVDDLVERWSQFSAVPLVKKGEIPTLKGIGAQSVAQYKDDHKSEGKRQDMWALYYRRNPYFHSFDEDGMKWMYKIIMSEVSPGLQKGATPEERAKVGFWMEVFTHFMEEVNRRGMDMKKFKSVMEEIGQELDRLWFERFPDSQ